MRLHKQGNIGCLLVILIASAFGAHQYYLGLQREAAQREANMATCTTGIKIIHEATEACNKDKRLGKAMTSRLDMKFLLEKKFLKSEPKCPDQGVYGITGFFGQSDGKIVCSVHGAGKP